MKTLIVLCSLATFTTAIPTLVKETFGGTEFTLDQPSSGIQREKKSPLDDTVHENQHEKESTGTGSKSHIIVPSFEGRSLGFKKPLIVKKNFGYHLYRDSDEEMIYADPHEKCKQVKVKVCDEDPNMLKNKISKNTMSAGLDISEKEVEQSIKMAKEAVENLQRDIQKMERSSAKLRENTKDENLVTDIELQEDIEVARKALDHITQSFKTIESIEYQSPMTEEILKAKSTEEERLSQWKNENENTPPNFEITKNIENTFRTEPLSTFSSENSDAIKFLTQINPTHEMEQKSNDELSSSSNNDNLKNIHDDYKIDPTGKSASEIINNFEEKPIIDDSDMFRLPTDNKEFKIELHSDSLKQENSVADFLMQNMGKEATITDETETALSEEKLETTMGLSTSTKNALPEHMHEPTDIVNKELNESEEAESLNKENIPVPMVSSEVTDLKTDEETKDETENLDSENKTDSFIAKESIESDILETEPTNNENITDKDADKPKQDIVSNDKGNHEANIRENLDVSFLKVDMFDEVIPINNMFKDESFNLLQRATSADKDIDEAKNMHSVEKEFIMIQPDTSSTIDTKESISNSHLAMPVSEHERMGRVVTENIENQEDSAERSVLDNNNYNEDLMLPHEKEFSVTEKESTQSKMSNPLSTIAENDNTRSLLVSPEKESNDDVMQMFEFDTDMGNMKNEQDEISQDQTNMRMIQDQSLAQTSAENHAMIEPHSEASSFPLKKETNNIHQQFKSVDDLSRELLVPERELLSEHIENEQSTLQTTGDLGIGKEFMGTNHDLNFMQLASTKDQDDIMSQEFKTASDFDINQLTHLLAPNNMNRLGNDDKLLNDKHSVRISDDLNTEAQINLQAPHISQWSDDTLDHLSRGFKSEWSPPKDELYNSEQMLRDPVNIRTFEGRNLQQQFTDQGLHGIHSTQWIEDKQHKHPLPQPFNHVSEHYNDHFRPHFHHQGHLHSSRFGNQFDFDNNQNVPLLKPKTHGNFHLMSNGEISESDSVMQPAAHFNMRDNGMQWDHHHGMSRSSYGSSLPLGVSSGAVGLFPNANTGCGIPLMLSCSPSVVPGRIAKTHPAIPAYRSGDDMMFYRKRDVQNIDETPVKIQKTQLKRNSGLFN